MPPETPLLQYLHEQSTLFMHSPANDMEMSEPEPAFGMPLFGVAAGNDPLWLRYKEEYIGAFHWTPLEAFSLAFPDERSTADELTVLVWILPKTKKTRQDNRHEALYPSERWARARILGEPKVNTGLRHLLLQALQERGIQATAPFLLPQWDVRISPVYGFASNWSERHAAYTAGLGTFGLSDGLITPLGKAVRVGAVILRGQLPVTPRPYSNHREYCLYFQDGSCGACIKRCPTGSVRIEGRDKALCKQHVYGAASAYIEQKWGLKGGFGCGLCQTGVPCEAGIPKRKHRANP